MNVQVGQRMIAPIRVPVDISQLVHKNTRSHHRQFSAAGIVPEFDLPSSLIVLTDPEVLSYVIDQLVGDSLQSMSSGGELTITAIDGIDGVEIEFADSRQVPSGATDSLFDGEPGFLNGEPLNSKSLSNVYRAVQALGGNTEIMNVPQGGVAITVQFPRCTLRASA